MADAIVRKTAALDTPWQTANPFLFCMHHHDTYPEGDEHMAPEASMAGRNLGNDFSNKDGWSMYHGTEVPGFPRHPHRGFETITLARSGFIDHADSLGAKARFGKGDVQWMTAGNGIVHSEMFPLVHRDAPNPTELFQIWLNLPREDKQRDPYFTMFWNEELPKPTFRDDEGRETRVTVVAGELEGVDPLEPPPTSWASSDDSEVVVWVVRMEPEAEWTLPPASPDVNRAVYLFEGESCRIGGETLEDGSLAELRPDEACELRNGASPAEFLVLQGRPIEEPVARRGPFVMNNQGEIRQAMLDYQRTEFGGWPWDDDAPVHPRDRGRFAVHIDGREERPAAE